MAKTSHAVRKHTGHRKKHMLKRRSPLVIAGETAPDPKNANVQGDFAEAKRQSHTSAGETGGPASDSEEILAPGNPQEIPAKHAPIEQEGEGNRQYDEEAELEQK